MEHTSLHPLIPLEDSHRFSYISIEMAAREPNRSDILYEDADICILHPDSRRGIEVFTISGSHNICKEGLLSYNELRRRHPEYGLPNRSRDHRNAKHNNLIFFRAPYNRDVSSFETSYDNKSPEDMIKRSYSETAIATIRIDPDKSYVYYSEARASGTAADIQISRVPMKHYIEYMIPTIKRRGAYRNHSGLIQFVYSDRLTNRLAEHSDGYGSTITRFFELVANIPHIPPEWFVRCHIAGPKKNNTRRRRSSSGSASRSSGSARRKSVTIVANNAVPKNTTPFQAEWVTRPEYGDEVPRCPKCRVTGGTQIKSFQHSLDCPYNGRLPAPKA